MSEIPAALTSEIASQAATSAAAVPSPQRPTDADAAPLAASAAAYQAGAAVGAVGASGEAAMLQTQHVSEEVQGAQEAGRGRGMAKRVARGGVGGGGIAAREEAVDKDGDSEAPSEDPATDVSRAWSPKGETSKGAVGSGARRGVAGSLVVRGLCQNVTEAAVLSLFGHVASGDGVAEADGGRNGVKSVRLLPLNRRYPSRVAYVNFASAAALQAGLRLDGTVPVWNVGSSLQVLRQESPGEGLQDAKASEGSEKTRLAEQSPLQPRMRPHSAEHSGSPLAPPPATPAVPGAKSGGVAGRGEGGGLPTSSLFGISPVAPRSMGPFVSPFAKVPPSVGGGATTPVAPSAAAPHAPSSTAPGLSTLRAQAQSHVPASLFGDAAGSGDKAAGASLGAGASFGQERNTTGSEASVQGSNLAKMDFTKRAVTRCGYAHASKHAHDALGLQMRWVQGNLLALHPCTSACR